MKVTLVASALLEHDGKYLLVQQARSRRQPGKWGPPGGKPEQGEELTEAALREVFEETGLKVELTGFVGILRSGHRSDPNLFVCFAARLLPGQDAQALQMPEGEISNGRWFELAELEAEVCAVAVWPVQNLYRRLSQGQIYPLDVVQHEPLDPAP